MSKYRILCVETGDYLYSREGGSRFPFLYSVTELADADFLIYKVFETSSKYEATMYFNNNATQCNTIRIPNGNKHEVILIKNNLSIFEIVEISDE